MEEKLNKLAKKKRKKEGNKTYYMGQTYFKKLFIALLKL